MINKFTESGSIDATHPMAFLLSEELDLPTAGKIRTGWVVEHRNNEILVDIGAKSEGVIAGQELQELDSETREKLAIGNEVQVYVVDIEDQHGSVIVSYVKAMAEQEWQHAQQLYESQEVHTGTVVDKNRGGLLVKVGLLRGFVPNSQVNRSFSGSGKQANDMGRDITFKVLEVDRKQDRLILSERAANKEMRKAKRAEMLASLNDGDVFEGRVINLADFGAFIDIGGIEGLVHLSELSWKRINKPADVLKVGDSVKVAVLNIDRKRERLALSIKQLETDPWTTIDEYYHVGQLLEAAITKLTKYGAFARLQDEYGLEGLIHISELSTDHVEHPKDLLQLKQLVTVRIIRIEPKQRQLGLSIKQVVSDKYVEADLELLTAVQDSEQSVVME